MFRIKHGHSREIVTDIFTQTKQQYNFIQNRTMALKGHYSLHGFLFSEPDIVLGSVSQL